MENMKMNQSAELKDLISALAKAQGVLKPAVFNRTNPHFRTKYADFTSCMDACRAPLSENGLAVIQYCDTIDGKLNLITVLAHVSGQWMRSLFPLIPSKMDSQGIGSAMTYAKRYSLCGMVGIVADEEGDDDGEAAVGRFKAAEKIPLPAVNPIVPTYKDLLISLEKDGMDTSYLQKYLKDLAQNKEQDVSKIIESAMLPQIANKFKECYAKAMEKYKANEEEAGV